MQPWPGEVLEERSGEIAVGFAALLTRQAAWRHRRVETIRCSRTRRSGARCPWTSRSRSSTATSCGCPTASGSCRWPLLAKQQARPLRPVRRGRATRVPLMRSDEARLIARELLYLMLDIDVEDAELDFDASDADRARAGGRRRTTTEAVTARVDARGRPGAGVRRAGRRAHARVPAVRGARRRDASGAWSSSRTTSRSGGRIAGRTSTARQGCTEAASYHVELGRAGGDARPHARTSSTTGRASAAREGPRDADRPGAALRRGRRRGDRARPAACTTPPSAAGSSCRRCSWRG